MTAQEVIATIRAEIERLKKANAKLGHTNDIERHEESAYDNACDAFLYFLSTLEESEKPMQEGLEKDVERWFFNEISSKINVEHTMYYYFQECARRYAQWGAEHQREQMAKKTRDAGWQYEYDHADDWRKPVEMGQL